jgi:hypothetical protein
MHLLLACLLAGFQAQPPIPLSIQAVTAAQTATGHVITLQLTGTAGPSTGRLLENPWRLYFDLPGVVPGKQRTVNVEAGAISHVRIGVNQPSPPVTRVVIELTKRVTWRLEPGSAPGEFRVVITDPSPGRVIYEPKPAAPAAPAARDRRAQITADLFQSASMLEAMRAWTGPSDAALVTLMAKAEELSTGARAMRVTGSAGDVALVAAVDALLAATRARAQALADGTPQSRDNAIAAAHGALLLLAHAQQQQSR